MQEAAEKYRREGQRIALVPTMGFLHEGHLSLIKKGRQIADILVVSVFVNPVQFAPQEDYESYPRDPERDRRLVEEHEADVLFMPGKSELYPEGYETYITQTELPQNLCGISRPAHFTGVMTVVAKLFNIVKPHYAVFGTKDYQQLTVIKKMSADLNFDTQIIGSPTIRESDGLAMSSRNRYLEPGQRRSALTLYQALSNAEKMAADGETRAQAIIDAAVKTISEAPDTSIDYVKICDPDTLEDAALIDRPLLMAVAVEVGRTRLIDNTMLLPPGES